MCLKHRNTGSPKSHYTLHEILKITQETEFIPIFSIDKGVVAVCLAIKFQCLEDLLYASRGALPFSTTFSHLQKQASMTFCRISFPTSLQTVQILSSNCDRLRGLAYSLLLI